MKKMAMLSVAAIALAACGGNGGAKGGSPEDVTAALTQLSLGENADGRVAFEDKSVKGATATFKDVTIRTSDFADTVEASDDSTVEVDVDSADLKVNEMTFTGLNLDDAGKATFASLTLNGLTAMPTDEDDTSTATAGKLELVNPTPELAQWVAGVLGNGESSDMPNFAETGFDKLALSNLSTSEDGEGTVAISTLEVTDLRDKKTGTMSLKGLAATFNDADSGEAGVFNIGEITLKAANFSMIEDAANGEGNFEDALTQMTSNPVDPGFDSVTVKNIDFNVGGLSFDLPKMDYTLTRNNDGIPTRYKMPEFKMTLNADADGGSIGAQVAPVLMMLGFEELELSASGDSTYDPATDLAETTESTFALKDAFVIRSTSKVGGYKEMGERLQAMDPDAFADGSVDPQSMMLDIYSVLDFHNLSFSLEDNGIVDKGFALAAAQMGQDPATLRTQAIGMVGMAPMMAGQFGIDPAIATEFSAAASTFLQNGGTLDISLNPEEAITLPQLMSDPSQITKDRLGFSASHAE